MVGLIILSTQLHVQTLQNCTVQLCVRNKQTPKGGQTSFTIISDKPLRQTNIRERRTTIFDGQTPGRHFDQ